MLLVLGAHFEKHFLHLHSPTRGEEVMRVYKPHAASVSRGSHWLLRRSFIDELAFGRGHSTGTGKQKRRD